MNPLAEELNNTIKQENPHVLEMLSDLGKNLFFPKGILSQTKEAKEKATKHNATIGIAKEKSEAMHLDAMMQHLDGLSPDEIFPYAPSEGVPALRKKWLEHIVSKNPTFDEKSSSLPVVTNALTHGLSIVGDMFIDPGDIIISSDKFWGNYKLIFSVRKKALIKTYSVFEGDGFNLRAFEECLRKTAGAGKVAILFNFPNNPTGYAVTEKEGLAIVDVVKEVAQNGANVITIFDDAYF